MKTKIIGLFAAAGVAMGWAAACNVEQPPAACPIPHTSIFVKYTPQDRTVGACAEIPGEFWTLSKYNVPGETTNRLGVFPEGAAAFQGDERLDDNDNIIAIGDFDFAATEGFCSGSGFAPATITVPEVSEMLADGGTDVTPAANLTYDIQELRLAGTTQVPGTQFTGRMKYSQDGCTATYDLLGISPAVDCCQQDEDGKCVENAEGNQIPDDSRCNATRDEETGEVHPACNGSHECLNPDFRLKCDPVTLFCIPAGEVPSLVE